MGFPSVCYEYVLLLLINKEAALAYGRTEYGKAGNPAEIEEKRRQSQGDAVKPPKRQYIR